MNNSLASFFILMYMKLVPSQEPLVCFLRDVHAPHRLHTVFTFLLFGQQLLATSDIGCMQLMEDVLALGLYGGPGNDSVAAPSLQDDLKQLVPHVFLELVHPDPAFLVDLGYVHNFGQSVHAVAINQQLKLDNL